MSVPILDHALNYAKEFGWAVFPCHSVLDSGICTCASVSCKNPAKHPAVSHGSLDASKDEDAVTAMFNGKHWANLGVATGSVSDLVVIDVDQGKGANVNDLLIGGLDQRVFNTFKVKTGAGLHFYYRLPVGVTVKNSASKLGQFIDVRGDGGYVIAPPSKHVSGRNYEILNSIDDVDLLDLPQQWLDKLSLPTPPTSQPPTDSPDSPSGGGLYVPVHSGVILPDEINQGQRNVEMTKIAGALRDKGLSEQAIYKALEVENQRICIPPLDDSEIRQISHSIARYTPRTVINKVSDDPNNSADDVLNSITAYDIDRLFTAAIVKKEILAFHIGRRDVAMVVAGTNAGKTTLLRNIALCMAAGRPFDPFYDGVRPIKIGYFDFENDVYDVRGDIEKMVEVFTPAEMEVLKKNFIAIPKALMDGDVFQFNTGEKWVESLIKPNKIEFILVDNIAAAFDLDNENNNAEVKRKVIKPLNRMALRYDCAFVFAHHYGKGTPTENEQAGVHASRGASNFENLSRTIFNMFGDVSHGEPSRIVCAKRKTDGGMVYTRKFELKADRWFHSSLKVDPPKPQRCIDAIVGVMEAEKWRKFGPKELTLKLKPNYGRTVIHETLKKYAAMGMLEKFSGKYWLAGEESDDDDE